MARMSRRLRSASSSPPCTWRAPDLQAGTGRARWVGHGRGDVHGASALLAALPAPRFAFNVAGRRSLPAMTGPTPQARLGVSSRWEKLVASPLGIVGRFKLTSEHPAQLHSSPYHISVARCAGTRAHGTFMAGGGASRAASINGHPAAVATARQHAETTVHQAGGGETPNSFEFPVALHAPCAAACALAAPHPPVSPGFENASKPDSCSSCNTAASASASCKGSPRARCSPVSGGSVPVRRRACAALVHRWQRVGG